MTDRKQVVKMKCPHCGWIRKIEIDVPAGQSEVVAGIRDFVNRLSQYWQDKIKSQFEDEELDDANSWLPMPACPNQDPTCGRTYEYNIYTGVTR